MGFTGVDGYEQDRGRFSFINQREKESWNIL